VNAHRQSSDSAQVSAAYRVNEAAEAAQAAEAVKARLGLRLAGLLLVGTTNLSPDIQERLRFARVQALERIRARRLATTSSAVNNGGGALTLAGPPAWWQRVLATLPLAVLVGGLFLVQHASQRELMLAAAEVDAVLLGDTLPPNAYSDPGFAEFLHHPQP